MNTEKLCGVEKAFVSYLNSRISGRSLRLKKKWYKLSEKELMVLNGPLNSESQVRNQEVIDQTPDRSVLSLDEQVLNKVAIQNAMKHLTQKELIIINRLFWEQKSIKEVCDELGISKTAVFKSRRNALNKMKASVS